MEILFNPYPIISFSLYTKKNRNNFNPKITAKQLVKNILRTFRPSTGALFNANNVPQTGWLATTPY